MTHDHAMVLTVCEKAYTKSQWRKKTSVIPQWFPPTANWSLQEQLVLCSGWLHGLLLALWSCFPFSQLLGGGSQEYMPGLEKAGVATRKWQIITNYWGLKDGGKIRTVGLWLLLYNAAQTYKKLFSVQPTHRSSHVIRPKQISTCCWPRLSGITSVIKLTVCLLHNNI